VFDRLANLLRNCAKWMRARADRVALSYLIPERGGFGWYVIGRNPAFDFDLNRELADFAITLATRGYSVHASLLPGSVEHTVPTDAIAMDPAGRVAAYGD
jgi:hypothetical protein